MNMLSEGVAMFHGVVLFSYKVKHILPSNVRMELLDVGKLMIPYMGTLPPTGRRG